VNIVGCERERRWQLARLIDVIPATPEAMPWL